MGSIDRPNRRVPCVRAGLLWLVIGLASVACARVHAQADAQGHSSVPAWLQRVEGWIKGDGTLPPDAPVTPPDPAAPDPASRDVDADALLAKLEAALGGQTKEASDGYVYVDERGRRVEVDSLSQVPAALRPFAVPRARAAEVEAAQRPDHVFRYRNDKGRDVFTNVAESVPLDQRAKAKLDLSQVPLNSELGGQINARLSVEHDKLSRSAYCKDARREAEAHRLQDLWDEYGPLFVVGAAILAFLVISPMMMRRVAVPAWVRTLRFVVPALAVAGGVSYSMMKTNRAISSFKRKAEPCMESTWTELGDDRGGLASKLALIQQLRSQVDMAQKVPNPAHSAERGMR